MFPSRDFISTLSIIKDGVSYALPCEWALSDALKVEFGNKLSDKAFAHGGTMYGDGKVKGKTIVVEFSLQGATEEQHDEAMNTAYRQFAQADYLLKCGRSDRVFKVAGISKISADYETGYKQRFSNIKVSLLLEEPFRYAIEPTIIVTDFTTDQLATEITFYNPSSVDVPLIWTFTPPTGGTVPSIVVLHAQSGQQFTLSDTLLTAPAISVVNAEMGTVRRDTGNSLNTFAGIFLHALPGTNTFSYTGAACKVQVAYTARWFV